MLLKCIERKYRSGAISIYECCRQLTTLNDNSNLRADIYLLEVIFDCVCEKWGNYSEKDIEDMLEEIFQQGIEVI